MERMQSVVMTCRQRRRNVLDYLIAYHEVRLLEHPIPSLLPEETAGIIAA